MQEEHTSPTLAGKEMASPVQTQPQRHTGVLFHHEPHRHQPRNVNQLHAAEQAEKGFNTRLAVTLTRYTGTMWTAYVFPVSVLAALLAFSRTMCFSHCSAVQSPATS